MSNPRGLGYDRGRGDEQAYSREQRQSLQASEAMQKQRQPDSAQMNGVRAGMPKRAMRARQTFVRAKVEYHR